MNFISKTTPNTKFAATHTLLPEGTQMTLISLIKISVISVNQRLISRGSNMPQGGAASDENSSQHPVSLRSPRLCGLFSGQSERLSKFIYPQFRYTHPERRHL